MVDNPKSCDRLLDEGTELVLEVDRFRADNTKVDYLRLLARVREFARDLEYRLNVNSVTNDHGRIVRDARTLVD